MMLFIMGLIFGFPAVLNWNILMWIKISQFTTNPLDIFGA